MKKGVILSTAVACMLAGSTNVYATGLDLGGIIGGIEDAIGGGTGETAGHTFGDSTFNADGTVMYKDQNYTLSELGGLVSSGLQNEEQISAAIAAGKKELEEQLAQNNIDMDKLKEDLAKAEQDLKDLTADNEAANKALKEAQDALAQAKEDAEAAANQAAANQAAADLKDAQENVIYDISYDKTTDTTTVDNNVNITKDLTIGGSASIAKDLVVGGSASIGTDLTVDNNAAVGNDLAVGNNASVGNDLTVGGTITAGEVAVGDNKLSTLGNVANLQGELAGSATVVDALNTEAATRAEADAALQAQIDANADAITNEAADRAKADRALQDDIDAEAAREAKDTELGKAIADEAAAREDADAAFQTQVDTNKSAIADNAAEIAINKAAITTNTADITAMKAVDAEMGNRISENTTAIGNNAKEIEANTATLAVHRDAIVANSNAIAGLGLNSLSNRVDKVGAGAAALAVLHPLDYDPEDKLSFSAGVGNYAGATAGAIGAFYRPNEDVMFSIGGTAGIGENMVNAGVSFAIGKGSSGVAKLSKAELIQEVNAVKAGNEALKEENKDIRNELNKLKAMVMELAAKK